MTNNTDYSNNVLSSEKEMAKSCQTTGGLQSHSNAKTVNWLSIFDNVAYFRSLVKYRMNPYLVLSAVGAM